MLALAAGSATGEDGDSVKVIAALVVLMVLVVARYALACWARPYPRCRRCGGLGLRMGKTVIRRRPVARGDCRRCRGSGVRLRLGRRVANHFIRLHKVGTR